MIFPCPNCKAKLTEEDVVMRFGESIRNQVVCPKCETSGPIQDTADLAVMKWNLLKRDFTASEMCDFKLEIVNPDLTILSVGDLKLYRPHKTFIVGAYFLPPVSRNAPHGPKVSLINGTHYEFDAEGVVVLDMFGNTMIYDIEEFEQMFRRYNG
jgi:hypothetical protein